MEFKTARDIWSAALGELQLQISKPNYRTWFEKTIGLEYEGEQLTVGAPTIFVAEYLDRSQRSLIEKTLIGIMHKNVKVSFVIKSGLPGDGQPGLEKPALNSHYTFDSFVVGKCNQLAHNAALEVAERPGQNYNPLYITGGAGVGKTHLLQAIGHRASETGLKVLYVSGEQYTSEFVSSLRGNRADDVRSKYRNLDMLLVDDIQFVSGKPKTEESLFHLFDELHDASHQMVITGDRFPKSLPQLNDRWRSRLEGGLIADIRAPDFDTRLKILQSKASQKGAQVTPDTLEIIAQRIKQNIRELEGSLNRVIAYARLIHDQITPDLAERALENIGDKASTITLSPSLLIEATADAFTLSPAEIKGQKRDKETALARQVAMYLMKQELSISLSQIGKELGDRNPATVTHACQKISAEIEANPYVREKIDDVKRRLHPMTVK